MAGRPARGRRLAALLLSLCLILLLGPSHAASAPRSAPYPAPKGPFVFYYGIGYWSWAYGLLSEAGEWLLPPEYAGIYHVYDHGNSVMTPYYQASVIDPARTGGEEDLLYALLSPSGEVLTDYAYSAIGCTDGVFYGMTGEGGLVSIDEANGTQTPVDLQNASAKVLAMWQWFHPYDAPETVYHSNKTGPDVPAAGFADVLENADGTYYADTGDGGSYGRYRLYSADGHILGGAQYRYISRIGGELYRYEARGGGFGLMRGSEALTGPIYKSIFWVGDYLQLVLSDKQMVADFSLKTLYEFVPEENDISPMIDMLEAPGGVLLLHRGYNKPTFVLNLDTGVRVTFNLEALDGTYWLSAGVDENTLLVGMTTETPTPYHLIDSQGRALVTAKSIYQQYDCYVAQGAVVPGVNPRLTQSLYGLYDRNGREILPCEFRYLQVLEGNAVLAHRGDRVGLIDLGGNWIYSLSVYGAIESPYNMFGMGI